MVLAHRRRLFDAEKCACSLAATDRDAAGSEESEVADLDEAGREDVAEEASDELLGEETPTQQARFEREERYMKERWAAVLRSDPNYNPNLALDRESFALAFPPRAKKPWSPGRS